ncbi:MAG: hypothetical protein ACE5GL_10145 [Calditrichia bacterium]
MNIHIAHRKYLLWFIAIVITLSSAVYQRITGPTYPKRGSIEIGGQKYSYRLLRSGIVGEDAEISLDIPRKKINGYIKYRRYKSLDNWTQVEMKRKGEHLKAYLPTQPAAGKLIIS